MKAIVNFVKESGTLNFALMPIIDMFRFARNILIKQDVRRNWANFLLTILGFVAGIVIVYEARLLGDIQRLLESMGVINELSYAAAIYVGGFALGYPIAIVLRQSVRIYSKCRYGNADYAFNMEDCEKTYNKIIELTNDTSIEEVKQLLNFCIQRIYNGKYHSKAWYEDAFYKMLAGDVVMFLEVKDLFDKEKKDLALRKNKLSLIRDHYEKILKRRDSQFTREDTARFNNSTIKKLEEDVIGEVQQDTKFVTSTTTNPDSASKYSLSNAVNSRRERTEPLDNTIKEHDLGSPDQYNSGIISMFADNPVASYECDNIDEAIKKQEVLARVQVHQMKEEVRKKREKAKSRAGSLVFSDISRHGSVRERCGSADEEVVRETKKTDHHVVVSSPASSEQEEHNTDFSGTEEEMGNLCKMIKQEEQRIGRRIELLQPS